MYVIQTCCVIHHLKLRDLKSTTVCLAQSAKRFFMSESAQLISVGYTQLDGLEWLHSHIWHLTGFWSECLGLIFQQVSSGLLTGYFQDFIMSPGLYTKEQKPHYENCFQDLTFMIVNMRQCSLCPGDIWQCSVIPFWHSQNVATGT